MFEIRTKKNRLDILRLEPLTARVEARKEVTGA